MSESDVTKENSVQQNDGVPQNAPVKPAESLVRAAYFFGQFAESPGVSPEFREFARRMCTELLEDDYYLSQLERDGHLEHSDALRVKARAWAPDYAAAMMKIAGKAYAEGLFVEITNRRFEAMLAELETTKPAN